MRNNLIQRVVDRLTKPTNSSILDVKDLVGWHAVNNEMQHYADDKYENGYSSIRAIANRFMVIRPYAIDDNGKPLTTTPNIIECLARPNEDMSGVDFRDALAVMTMVHDNVYVLVHERYGATTRPARENVPEERIAGFTFLENVLETKVNGELQYEIYSDGEKEVYYPYQVMHFYDTNPSNLSKGYSPSRAARRWTRIDDYIADYQTGFFENGAVPAGQFVITAPTVQEYKDIVRNLKKKHRGAKKNNNVTYTYAPIDPATGKPGQASITWVPFNTTNKDLALKDIFEQSNKKIDSVYGVSAFIRAIDEAPNFATAQVIERNFVENTMRPFSIKKYSRIQHELNRITGGIGYGIAFELDTPHIAEEQKMEAETNSIIANTINSLSTQGYTLDSIANAMRLSPTWKLLEKGDSTETVIDNPKPEVTEDINEAPEDKSKPNVPTAELSDEDTIALAARNYMQSQVDRAVKEYKLTNEAEPTDDELETFINAVMLVVAGILLTFGDSSYQDGLAILASAGIDTSLLNGYTLSDQATAAYRLYLQDVGASYGKDTAESIRKVLSDADQLGYTRKETEDALRNIMNTDEYRVKRLARTELNNSQNTGKLEGMKELSKQSEVSFEKTIDHSGVEACPLCQSQEGIWTPIEQPLWSMGSTITDAEGTVYVNDWRSLEAQDYHTNGRGTLIFRKVEA